MPSGPIVPWDGRPLVAFRRDCFDGGLTRWRNARLICRLPRWPLVHPGRTVPFRLLCWSISVSAAYGMPHDVGGVGADLGEAAKQTAGQIGLQDGHGGDAGWCDGGTRRHRHTLA